MIQEIELVSHYSWTRISLFCHSVPGYIHVVHICVSVFMYCHTVWGKSDCCFTLLQLLQRNPFCCSFTYTCLPSSFFMTTTSTNICAFDCVWKMPFWCFRDPNSLSVPYPSASSLAHKMVGTDCRRHELRTKKLLSAPLLLMPGCEGGFKFNIISLPSSCFLCICLLLSWSPFDPTVTQ